tara:strand:+ start:2055 stop:2276 length:222 start_codon:yes stop_codon:yes gene_type:complete
MVRKSLNNSVLTEEEARVGQEWVKDIHAKQIKKGLRPADDVPDKEEEIVEKVKEVIKEVEEKKEEVSEKTPAK